MSERDNESFDLDDEFLSGPTEDGTDYDRLLDRVDKRVRNQGKKGKAAWSKLEEVLADKKLEKDLLDFDDELYSLLRSPPFPNSTQHNEATASARTLRAAAACAARI